MLRFAYFVFGFIGKVNSQKVFEKYNEKIKIPSAFYLPNILQHLRLRGVYLELRV